MATYVGANLQTVPDAWDMDDPDHPLAEGMRDLFEADPGCYIAKADLKGADGWTIGAYMAMLGDRTMLDDLLFGIKPAQVVAYILYKSADAYLKVAHDRTLLHAEVQCIKKDMWQYFVSKIGIWGFFYTQGWKALGEQVFVQSEGKVNLSAKDAKAFQESIGVRYKARKLHAYFQDQISRSPYPFKLTCPNGSMRRFFGRKDEVLGEVLAHVPQVVTTYATLLAVNKLWNDPENRTKDPNQTPLRELKQGHATPHPDAEFLRIEPLHQVHDELVMQFRIEDLDWAKQRIAYYFDNPIMVAGQRIVIPYDGAVSSDWSMNNKISSL